MTDGDRSSWSAYLAEDERILWQGVPNRRLILLRPADAGLIPFFLVWGGFPAFFIFLVPAIAFLVIPVIFVGIGAYMLIGRFFVDGWRRRSTSYLLTDRKALMVQSWPRFMVRDVSLGGGLEISLEGRSVRFGPDRARNGDRTFGLAPAGVVFEDVDAATRIFRLASEARATRA